jgi:uncharacterized membrane protein
MRPGLDGGLPREKSTSCLDEVWALSTSSIHASAAASRRPLSLKVSLAALFASLYASVTILETALGGPIAYGPIQVRVADALLPLPMIFGMPAAYGLCLGCLAANAFYMLSPLDVLLGSIANLIAGTLSAKLSGGRLLLAATYPVVVITLIVGSYLPLFYAGMPPWLIYAGVAAGEAVACYGLGLPLLKALSRAFQPSSARGGEPSP